MLRNHYRHHRRDYKPVLVAHVFYISRYSAELFTIAAQNLRVELILPAATVAQTLHNRVYFLLKNFGQLYTKIIIELLFKMKSLHIPLNSIYEHEKFSYYKAKR